MTYDIGVFTRRRIISPAESYFAVPAAVVSGPYVGPGEAPGPTLITATSPGWRAYWGMRAFTAAIGAAGTNAIRIRDSTTTTETDIRLTSTGGLNATDISTALPGGHTGTVVTFYDQTGQNNHLTQATSALQPAFIPSIALAGGKPGARFNGAHVLYRAFAGTWDLDTRFSFLGVFMSTGTVVSVRNDIISGGGGNAILQADSGATDRFGITSSSHVNVTAIDNVYHTAITDYQQTPLTSNIYVDGTPGTASDIGGPTLFLGQIISMGAQDNAATVQPHTGDACEGGIYNGDVTSFISALDANMSGYYGI